MKCEFLIHKLVAAISNDIIKFDNNPAQEYEIDFREDLKSVVPSLKLGIGYNLILGKGININIGLFLDFRNGSYFKDTDQYNYLNWGLEFGVGYSFR